MDASGAELRGCLFFEKASDGDGRGGGEGSASEAKEGKGGGGGDHDVPRARERASEFAPPVLRCIAVRGSFSGVARRGVLVALDVHAEEAVVVVSDAGELLDGSRGRKWALEVPQVGKGVCVKARAGDITWRLPGSLQIPDDVVDPCFQGAQRTLVALMDGEGCAH